jgi:spermidine dehydrogenase
MTKDGDDKAMPRIERRELLAGLALAGLAGCSGEPAGDEIAAAEPQNQAGYYPPTRTGMRGSHPGSFEPAHALRDGTLKLADAKPTGEDYDLVIVGAGISGLSAAHVLRKERPNARILILENHDDFGGHAKRNEFVVDGRTLLVNGGTMLISSPRPYGPVSAGIMRELGIDAVALAKNHPRDDLYDRAGLGAAAFFDKETFGTDALVKMPEMRFGPSADEATGDMRKELAETLARSPLPPAAQRDLVRLQFDAVDYLPGLDEAGKRRRLSRISYRTFLETLVKVHPAAVAFYQTRTHGEWGIGIDAEPALDCWGIGLPGFAGMKLDRANTDLMGNTAAGYSSTGGSPSFHFPDGNATIARALVRRLVPHVAPAGDIDSVVMAKFDYGQLDRPGQPVRIRLNSVAVQATPKGENAVEVAYIADGALRMVRARGCVLACYNMLIPYLVPTLPEPQKAALHELVKVPLVYTAVAVRNWRAFAKLGLQNINCPGSFFSSISLSSAAPIGGYAGPRSPDDPALIFMVRTPCAPGAPTERDQHRAGRYELLGTDIATFETQVRDQLTRVLGAGGFDAKRDIAAITVNRWPHGYAFEYNPLYDPWDVAPEDRPHMIGRRRFGPIAIANSDSGAAAYTDCAIDQGHRAVHELLDAKVIPA